MLICLLRLQRYCHLPAPPIPKNSEIAYFSPLTSYLSPLKYLIVIIVYLGNNAYLCTR